MERIRDDLWQTFLSTREGVNSSGFLLLRDTGNVQFYFAPMEADFERIHALGGFRYLVISHRHELDPSPASALAEFGAKLCADAAEAPVISSVAPVDIVLRQGDNALGDLECLDTPGHTEGGASFVYRSPLGETYLFSGDTMIPVAETWVAQTLAAHGGDAATLLASLRRLRGIAPDLVLSSASVGRRTVVETGKDAWISAVDEVSGRAPIDA